MRPSIVKNSPANPVNLAVLKFGGSVLQNAASVHAAAHEIYRYIRRGEKVVAVVSALAGETDALQELSQEISGCDNPPGAPALMRLGEIRTAALLELALERIGVDARAVDPAHIDLRASGDANNAALNSVDHEKFDTLLVSHDALVVPGFSGVLDDGRPALLGRGGTDLSAIYLGAALNAKRVRLIKDVDGLYNSDPKQGAKPHRFSQINWSDARDICGKSIQPQALDFAKEHNLRLEIAAPGRRFSTLISPDGSSSFAAARCKKLKIALLGFGTVGQGVYAHLQRYPDLFEVSGILVRDPLKPRDRDVPDHLLSTEAAEVLSTRPDIVVEMIGGVNAANAYIQNAFFGGADVVSANKAVMANNFDSLTSAAQDAGRVLQYSAAAGGGVPMLEGLDLAREEHGIKSISGVINGTANFILDRLADGCAFETAVVEAQEAGFAEADPSADLDGDDAAAKLCLMARRGFDLPLQAEQIACESLSDLSAERIQSARENGKILRQVSEIKYDEKGDIHASVCLKELDAEHFLARAKGEQNHLLIEMKNGEHMTLRGKGAGRWPTAEAVIADIFDIHRLRGQYEETLNQPLTDTACA